MKKVVIVLSLAIGACASIAPDTTATSTTIASAGTMRVRKRCSDASRSVWASVVSVSRYDDIHHTATVPATARTPNRMSAWRRAFGSAGRKSCI